MGEGNNEALLKQIFLSVAEELERANAAYPYFNSAHEGYAVILEELDELKHWVWQKPGRRDKHEMRKEAIQIAAMAIKFIVSMEAKK